MSDPLPSFIKRLSGKNIDSDGRINLQGTCVVLFYSSGCGHCRSFAPKFAACSQNNRDVSFYGINAGENGELFSRSLPFSLRGVPMTVIFNKGNPCSTISGDRIDILQKVIDSSKRNVCCMNDCH
jgi:thiol-disulfide isomerase/thioredoxin